MTTWRATRPSGSPWSPARTVSGVRLDRPGDVATVLRVLYLVFDEGRSKDVGLAAEAIRLNTRLRD